MAKNKIITSQGNVQFINSKGKTISMHPMHCYAVYQDDTVSFLFIYMKEYSGQAFFASQFEDLEVDGETYDSIDALKEAIAEAFAKAGAQARTEIVDELPETGYTNTIYLVKKEHGEGYDEYIYNEEKGWQLIGDTDIEFERYLQKVDFNAYSADTKEKIDFISGAVDTNASDIQFISGAVDTEISNREAADSVISGAVDTLSTNLSNEVQRAQNAEQTLQNNINTANARIDAEQIARANADNAISGAVDSVVSDLASEVSRATAKENEIDSKVDGEISDREAADSVISGAVDTLSANLSLEAQRAQNAESALNSKVNALSGEVETMGDESIVDAAYVSSSTTIDFYNASGDVVAQVDATDFIKDGMIEDVRIENGYLIIDFNTASGKQDISIPLTDIFNPANYYDKTAVDGFISNLEAADSVISGAVDTVSADLATEAQRAQNAEGALSGAIDTKLAISDFNTYSGNVETELGAKANSADVYTKSEVYTKGEVDEAIAEIDLSDYYTTAQTDSKLALKADLSALTEDERVWGEALNDLNSRINTVSGDVANKVDTSVYNTYTANTQTTINAKANSADVYNKSQVYTKSEVDELIADIDLSEIEDRITEDEEVTSAGLNALNESLSEKQDTLIAGDNITISGNVISATGGGSITVDSALDSGSTNPVENRVIYNKIDEVEQVTAAGLNAVNDKFDGLKLKKLTQAEYDALTTKDSNTLYIVI